MSEIVLYSIGLFFLLRWLITIYNFFFEANLPIYKDREVNQSISICIHTFNDQKNIYKVLSNLLLKIRPEVKEILIADSGSNDQTIKIVNDFQNTYSNIKLIKILPSVEAHTHLSNMAESDYLLFLKTDVIIRSQAIVSGLIRIKKYKLNCLQIIPDYSIKNTLDSLFVPYIYYLIYTIFPIKIFNKFNIFRPQVNSASFLLCSKEWFLMSKKTISKSKNEILFGKNLVFSKVEFKIFRSLKSNIVKDFPIFGFYVIIWATILLLTTVMLMNVLMKHNMLTVFIYIVLITSMQYICALLIRNDPFKQLMLFPFQISFGFIITICSALSFLIKPNSKNSKISAIEL